MYFDHMKTDVVNNLICVLAISWNQYQRINLLLKTVFSVQTEN